MKKLTYDRSGVAYKSIDPVKKIAIQAAKRTRKNLIKAGFDEIEETRGESAFVWKQGNVLMASVIEGLGTKNLVADTQNEAFWESLYKIIGYDTVACIVNDLISVGAKPLVINAYWAVGSGEWLSNKKRTIGLIAGWESACNDAGATWGGGETPALSGIVDPKTIDLAGSAIGIIKNPKNLITDKNIKISDRIILIKSNGINCNGLSLARAVAEKLPENYSTKISADLTYGEALLTQTNIYAKLISDLQSAGISINYVSNITGHGLRKIMRSTRSFTYFIENLFKPQPIFSFIQKQANLTDYEMYETFNMGQDFALFVNPKDVPMTQKIIEKNGYESLDAGYVNKGPRKLILNSKKLEYSSETLNLR